MYKEECMIHREKKRERERDEGCIGMCGLFTGWITTFAYLKTKMIQTNHAQFADRNSLDKTLSTTFP